MTEELREYIEDNGYHPVEWGGDWYQCTGGHLWNVDDIEKEMEEEKKAISRDRKEREEAKGKKNENHSPR